MSTNGPAPHWNDGSPAGRPRGECHHTIPGTHAPEGRTFCPTAVSRDSKRQSAATPMPARKRDAEREQTRKLRNLPKPQLSTKDAVRRRSGSVAGMLLSIIAAFAASLGNVGGTAEGQGFSEPGWGWLPPEVSAEEAHEAISGTFRYELPRADDMGRSSGRTIPTDGCHRRGQPATLKAGERKLLASKAAKSAQLLEMERDTTIQELSRAHESRSKTDTGTDFICMNYEWANPGPKSPTLATTMTREAPQYGLTTSHRTREEPPVPWSQEQCGKWKHRIRQERPMVAIVQCPPELDPDGSAKQKSFWNATMWTLQEQARRGRFWILVHPQGKPLVTSKSNGNDQHFPRSSGDIRSLRKEGRKDPIGCKSRVAG